MEKLTTGKELQQKAREQKKANQKFLHQLSRKDHREIDELFHSVHDEVFAKVDCLDCANCCKTTSPIFYAKDIERVAKRLRMRPSAFMDQYLKTDSEGDFVLQSSPCAFLDDENKCIIYEDRPAACREYPHTNRRKMYQLLDLTLKNTAVCPAVLEMLERMRHTAS